MVLGAAEQAFGIVEAVADDPGRRLEVADRFYDDRPGRASIRTYRRAELAFMRWQVTRGVLAPTDSAKPGSAWWRGVNAGLLRDAWEADLLAAGQPGSPSRPSVSRWLQFLDDPSPQSWYRAHDASVVAGYLQHRHLADGELPVERFFMDVALARVLFVHSLVMDPRRALGRWLWPLGRPLGDPRFRGTDVFLSLRNILPDVYPTRLSIAEVLDRENSVGRLIDYGIVLPRMQALYEFAAADLEEPALLSFISCGAPSYAWPYEDRDAWVATKSGGLMSLVYRLTSPA